MKVLTIRQNGPLVVVETTGGLRSSGATVESALTKLYAVGGLDPSPEAFVAVGLLFGQIPDDGRGSQIHEGVQS